MMEFWIESRHPTTCKGSEAEYARLMLEQLLDRTRPGQVPTLDSGAVPPADAT
jgi:hypothetical protein